jgi:hypothetical protein
MEFIMSNVTSEWPEYFPAGCPPVNAVVPNGIYFRFVKNNPPTDEDFKPHIILFPARKFKDKASAAHGVSEIFMASGLSLYQIEDHLQTALRRIPGLRVSFIVRGQVSQGKIRATPKDGNSHHTWWVPLDCNPVPLFSEESA